MAGATQNRAQIDQLLTNVSQKIVPYGYLSEQILPLLNVAQYSGKIGKYGNDHLRILNTVAGGKNGYAMVDVDVRSSDTYYIETHALKTMVTDEDYRNVIKPFDAERDAIAKLVNHLWLGKEKSLADSLTNTSIITQNVTLSGTNQYNDYTNSDPIGDFTTAIETVADNIGYQPNTAIMSRKVFRTLKYHPAILDSLGFKDNRPGGLSVEELAKAIDVDRVLVGAAIFNDAVEGQTDDIKPVWGKDIVFCHTPLSASLDQKSLGYRVQLAGQSPRQVFKTAVDEPVGANKLICLDKYDQILTDVSCAYLIKAAIA